MLTNGISQTLNPTIVSAQGGVGKTNNISLEWTLGENWVETGKSPSNFYTQGFHQTLLHSKLSPSQPIALSLTGTITLFPNPAKSNLNILISQFEDSHLTFSLIGVSGKKVLEYDAAHLNNEKIIMNISGLAPGLYLLHIKDHQGSHLQTQKILIIN
jgi:hypothetical protein